MPKICVQSPEVVSEGEIKIHARVNVTTKAKLDTIEVQGDCQCDGAVKPVLDLVFVIDGSDSFNRRTNDNEEIFDQTCKWVTSFVEDIGGSERERVSVSVVQFSGVNQLEKSYIPGDMGENGQINMFQVEVQSTPVEKLLSSSYNGISRKMSEIEHLDGNGQLFLCLQDLCMDNFLKKLSVITPSQRQDRKRILIIVSDPEWDCKKLRNGFGSGYTDEYEVCRRVHQTYDSVFPVILRPSRHERKNNESFIRDYLANGNGNSTEIYLDDWKSSMNKAKQYIMNNLQL